MPLTDIAVRKATPREKPYRLADGGGMYLEVAPSGGKYWRLKYRFAGKEKRLALGVYPDVSLAAAREKRDDALKKLAADIDPGEAKKVEKRAIRLAATNSFEAVARGWMDERKPYVTPGSWKKTEGRFEKDVFPWIGKRPVAEIDAPEILTVLKRIDSRGARFTARCGVRSAECSVMASRKDIVRLTLLAIW